MTTVECREAGCGWDTRGSNAGAGTCVDMRRKACLLALVCSNRFDDDDCGHEMEAVLAEYAAASKTEPTPGPARTETWSRGLERVEVHVDERGIVEVSAEGLALLLADAGWERAS